MKKYIGLKVVKAEPMTMTEAQKVLGRELKPAIAEEDGYLVEYKDGYKSWSPKSVFDEAYKPCETFLDRMKVEFAGEVDKFKKGDTFIRSEKFNELPLVARVLLYAQNKTQKMYCGLLENRIDAAENNNPLLKLFDFGTAIKFLKNLWHPIEEEPKHDKQITYVRVNGLAKTIILNEEADKYNRTPSQIWHNICKNYKVTCWFYIDDLFPEEGGEE